MRLVPARDEVVDLETVEHTVDEIAPDVDVFGDVQGAAVVEVAEAETVRRSEDYDFSVVWPEGPEEAADGDPEFAMPPLELSHEPDQDGGEVSDEVAEAVRRAIAAIESASVAATPAAEVTGQLPRVDDFTIEFTDAAGTSSHDVAPATGTAASALRHVRPAGDGHPSRGALRPDDRRRRE